MSDTTDDLTPDGANDLELASAYLDGEATSGERARVEASDELLADVERLRQVRAVLGATAEPPPISVREADLAAALGVWDRMSEMERSGEATPADGVNAAAAAAISTPMSTSATSRRDRFGSRSASKWLLGAAAGLVVLAGAGIVFQGAMQGADDSESNATADLAPAEEPESEVADDAEIAADVMEGEDFGDALPTDVDSDDVAADGSRAASTEAAPTAADADTSQTEAVETDAAMDEGAADESESDDAAGEAEPTSLDDGVDDAGTAEPPAQEVDLADLETSADLADFGALAAYVTQDAEAPPDAQIQPAFATCDDVYDFERFAGPASYRGQPVTVGIELDRELVIAYADDCTEVARVALPPLDEFENRPQE